MAEEKNLHVPGMKDDSKKLPVYTLVLAYFPRAIEEVARVSKVGAIKYTPEGWRTVPDGVNRYSDAMVRHNLEEAKGHTVSVEEGEVLYHAAQVAWNALARLELMLTQGVIGNTENSITINGDITWKNEEN